MPKNSFEKGSIHIIVAIFVLVVIVAIGGYFGYKSLVVKNVPINTTERTTPPELPPAPGVSNSNKNSAAEDSPVTDQLDADTSVIDKKLNTIDTEAKEAESGLDDQQTDLD